MGQLSLTDVVSSNEQRVDPGDWDDHIAPPGRPQIVVGGPGTGKTEFLTRRVVAALAAGTPPEQVLVLAFSRTGVSDLRRRLADAIGADAYRIVVATYHSIAMRLLEAHAGDLGWSQPPAVLTAAEHEQLIVDLLAQEDPSAWPAAFRPILTSTAMAADVTNFVLRASEQLRTVEDITEANRGQWKAMAAFLDAYDAGLVAAGRIDYGRVLTAAISLLETSAVSPSYEMVVADEFQDTSPAQAKLLMLMAAGAPDLVVAADPYQSIYSFRGADINNVFAFPDTTEAHLGVRADRLILTTSFRVPEELLASAVAVTARELPGGAGKVLSTRSGGTVSCHEFGTAGDEAEWIASEVERLHLTEGVPLERMAVFTRTHGQFVDDLVRSLERRSIAHTQSEERLADERIIRFLHDIVAAATAERDDALAALRRVLLGPFVRTSQGLVSAMPDGEAPEIADWLQSIGQPELADLVASIDWCVSDRASDGLWYVWSTLPILARVATDPEFERDRMAWSAYAQVLGRISQRDAMATLLDHASLSQRFDFEADALFSVHEAVGVTIATLHRSKGTEYDVVFIADAVEGSLPDLRATDSALGVRHLNPNLPTATEDYITFRLDEERRLAYTAMTRSTGRVVWTATVASDEGEGTSPSRFMRLVAPSTPAGTFDRPLTPGAWRTELRRIVTDPEAAPVDRLAALRFLATDATTADPLDRYGARRQGRDTGVIAGEIRLSPSRAGSYEDCPRRYLGERLLLSKVDESPYMKLGSLLHDVLERSERRARDEGRERATEAEALADLDEVWPELGFGDDSVAAAWKRRAATLISNLYQNWPSAGVPVELEVDLDLDVEGTPWRGRADRIEKSGSSLTVVDYKSGNPAKVDDAAESIQLGYYALAAARNEAVSKHGTVDAAEFWHPKEILKSGITTREFDMANLDEVYARMVAVAEGIEAEVFPPTPSERTCRTCPVIGVCPGREDGAEAFLP